MPSSIPATINLTPNPNYNTINIPSNQGAAVFSDVVFQNLGEGVISVEGYLENAGTLVIGEQNWVDTNNRLETVQDGHFYNDGIMHIYSKFLNKYGGYGEGSVNNKSIYISDEQQKSNGIFINNGQFDNFYEIEIYTKLRNEGMPFYNGAAKENQATITIGKPGTPSGGTGEGAAILENVNGYIFNYGIVYNNGTIDNSGPYASFTNYDNGKIVGNGLHKGELINHGAISPGNSTGGYLIDGTLFHNEGGNKIYELGGTDDADRDSNNTEYDYIDVTGGLIINGGALEVSLIDGFKLSAGDSFVIAKVDGDLSGQYDGLKEGDSVGRFKSDKGSPRDLFITYQGGDGNDIELYTKSLFGVLPKSLREPRIIGSAENDLLTGSSANEVIFGASGNDVLLGGGGDDQVTGGNGNDRLDGGSGDDHLKGDRGADTYTLSRGDDVIIGFSFAENDRIYVGNGVELSLTQVGDDLLLTADGIHTTLLDVGKVEFLAADCINYI
ncbi:calcium-binding protein [Prochlorococcus sp. MIT 1303]|uniref:calcium-binding protein n=1 Tax=Prochlorococcus sp. MIT 1303 TaxID=1723647 RepID=UPI0007BC5176|nr:calcium-binding protein [Prochlorococcus sp. MIT 1303]KZR64516.1 Hemolysin, plasmid [Prochlorococcus sp. MIT 1303]